MRLLALVSLVAVLGGFCPALGSTLEDAGTAKVMPGREAAGEPCAVCGRALGPADKAVLVKGRWVPLHDEACRARFESDPEAIFASMQPRGALIHESFRSPSPLRWGWFLAGGYVLIGLVCGGLASHMAYPRGRSPLRWFAAGLASNIAAVAILALSARPDMHVPPGLGKLRDTPEPVSCPSCGAPNHPAARCCLSCSAAVAPEAESEAFRAATGRS